MRQISRRGLLAAGTAGAVGAVCGPAVATATAATTGIPHLVDRVARRYGVPSEVLLAMGYVNTRWEAPDPKHAAYRHGDPERRGSFGVMALERSPDVDTLGHAARLLGRPPADLVVAMAANVAGGAALLAHCQGATRPSRPQEWLGAVAGNGGFGPVVRAHCGIGAGELYAEQVAAALAEGFQVTTRSGSVVVLEPTQERADG